MQGAFYDISEETPTLGGTDTPEYLFSLHTGPNRRVLSWRISCEIQSGCLYQ